MTMSTWLITAFAALQKKPFEYTECWNEGVQDPLRCYKRGIGMQFCICLTRLRLDSEKKLLKALNSRWHLWPSMRCYSLLNHIYKHCPVIFLKSWCSPEKELVERSLGPEYWHIHRISSFNFSGLSQMVLYLPVVDIASLNLFEEGEMATVCGSGRTAQVFG